MSFPKMDNSIKSAIKDLKEIVSRHQGADKEVVSLVSEIESIISDIETKAGELAKSARSKKSETGMVLPTNQVTNRNSTTIPVL